MSDLRWSSKLVVNAKKCIMPQWIALSSGFGVELVRRDDEGVAITRGGPCLVAEKLAGVRWRMAEGGDAECGRGREWNTERVGGVV